MRFITTEKEQNNYCTVNTVLLLLLPYFCTYFSLQLCSFCWRGRQQSANWLRHWLAYKTPTDYATDLLIYLSRYFDQETAKNVFGLQVKLPPVTTCYYSSSLTVQRLMQSRSVPCPRTQQANLPAGLSSHYPFIAKR